MADYPAGAFVTGTGVKNAALEFNTCIYKASDVPAETRRDDINFAKPITCFEWQNVYVYDFDKGRFQANWADVPGRGEPYHARKCVPTRDFRHTVYCTRSSYFFTLRPVPQPKRSLLISRKLAESPRYRRCHRDSGVCCLFWRSVLGE